MASEDSAARDLAQKRRKLNYANPAIDLGMQLHSQPVESSTNALREDRTDAPTAVPSTTREYDAYLKTLRVRGLSATHNRGTAKNFLRSALALDASSRLEICSLALSPHQPEEKVATINFDRTSKVLQSNRNEWVIDISDAESSDDDENPPKHRRIIIDSHFEGFTPMSSFEKAEDHKIEQVSTPNAGVSLLTVVAVSGLGSHAFGSFKERGSQHMWLRDALPADIPSARILIYGYHTRLADSRSFQDLEALASTFRSSLGAIRNQYISSARRKPLLFIGHSLGGLVIKEALIQMSEGNVIDKLNLASTYGILFFGVPNQGIDISSLIPMVKDQPNMLFLMTLGRQSGYLRNQHRAFCNAFDSRDSKIISFYETEESPTAQKHGDSWAMTGTQAVLVDSSSATYSRPWETEAHHAQAINRNHSDMVKFSPQDKYYYIVLQHLRQLAADAVNLIQTRLPEPKDCLQSLSSPEFGNRLNDVCDPHNVTFQWIWKNETFCQWLENDKAIFWVQGKPGCGKSTLMKLLFQNRSTVSTRMANVLGNRPITAGYFFCGRGTQLERSMEGLLRSLLVQILEQDPSLFSHALKTYGQMRERLNCSDRAQWDTSSLRRIFVSSITETPPSRGICLFVDALDECDGPLQDHVSFLQRIAAHPALKSSIKICISGRPTTILYASLESYPSVSLPEETTRDIHNYVHEKTGSLPQSTDDGDDGFQLLRAQVIQRANGVFLWVSLVVDELLKGDAEGDTIGELRDRLSSIPPDLDGLYHRMLGGIEDRYIEETRLMLRLILCAIRPLTLAEFRFAIAFGSEKSFDSQSSMVASKELVRGDKEMERRIRSRCGGLVEVNTNEAESQATVKFIHQSVKDFLLSGDGFLVLKSDPEGDSVAEGHKYLLRSCIQYLAVPELKTLLPQLQQLQNIPRGSRRRQLVLDTSTQRFPFLEYAIPGWLEHWKVLEGLGVCQSSQVRKLESKKGWSPLQTFIMLFNVFVNPGVEYPSCTTLLHIAIAAGIISFIEEELLAVIDVDAPRGREGTLLHTASYSGLELVVRMLIRSGADVNHKGYSNYGTALQAAALGGHEAVVRLLLEKGADVNAEGGLFGSPLRGAILGGSEEVVRLLLRNGADMNNRGGSQWSTPQLTTHTGREGVARLLVENGLHTNATDAHGCTAVHWMAMGGWASILKMLMGIGSDPFTRDKQGRSALHHAASGRSADCIKFLLGISGDPNIPDRNDWTPLHWACKGGNADAVKALIENGAAKDRRTDLGWSPIRIALFNGHADVVIYLLSALKDSLPNPRGYGEQQDQQTAMQPLCSGLEQFCRGSTHNGCLCDGCELEVRGVRHRCSRCPNFDYCFKCILTSSETHPGHAFFEEPGILDGPASWEIPSHDLPYYKDEWAAAIYRSQM